MAKQKATDRDDIDLRDNKIPETFQTHARIGKGVVKVAGDPRPRCIRAASQCRHVLYRLLCGSIGKNKSTPIAHPLRNRGLSCQQSVAILFSTAFIARFSIAADAGPRTNGSPIELEEIVVTATKRDEPLQRIPAAITVLSRSTLEREGAEQFADYAALVPGLSDSSGGAPGHSLVILRGLTTGYQTTSPTVGFVVDDTPFTPSGSQAIAAGLTPDPDLGDVERIEVLKGPQGTLYGASTLGGLIKIVSKKPDLANEEGSFRASSSIIDGGGTGYSARGSLNMPLIADEVALRAFVFHRDDPGFMTNAQLGTRDTNRTVVNGARLQLRIQPTDRLDVELNAFAQTLNTYGYSNVDSDPETLRPLYGDRTYRAAFDPHFDTHYKIFSAATALTLESGTLTNILSWGSVHDLQTADFSSNYGLVNDLLGLTLPVNSAVFGRISPNMQKLTEEIRFAGARWKNVEVLAGAFFTNERDTYDLRFANVIAPQTTPLPDPTGSLVKNHLDSTYREYAGFANLTYYLNPDLDATVGARYSPNHQTAQVSASGLLVGPQAVTNDMSSSDHSTTYLLTVRYRPWEVLDSYFRVATGYRPGGPQLNSQPGQPDHFDPDTVTNYEFGAKGRWLEGQLTSNVAVYYIDWRKIQINYVSQGVTFFGNGAKASSKGIELETQYAPTKSVTIGVNGSYTNARIGVADDAVGAQAGDPLPYTPQYSGSAFADYSRPIGAKMTWNVGGTFRYQGRRYSSFSQDPLNTSVSIPHYSVLDARFGLDAGRYSVNFRLENVTNVRGVDEVVNNRIAPGQDVPSWVTIIRPRTYVLALSARW